MGGSLRYEDSYIRKEIRMKSKIIETIKQCKYPLIQILLKKSSLLISFKKIYGSFHLVFLTTLSWSYFRYVKTARSHDICIFDFNFNFKLEQDEFFAMKNTLKLFKLSLVLRTCKNCETFFSLIIDILHIHTYLFSNFENVWVLIHEQYWLSIDGISTLNSLVVFPC